MFLFLILIGAYSIAVDLPDSNANNVQLIDIQQSPAFKLELISHLNQSKKTIESFSKDLVFYYESASQGPKRSITHRFFGELPLQPYENTSRVRAFNDDYFYWLRICGKTSEIIAYNFKNKTEEPLIQLNYEVVALKLSRMLKNKMWVIANSKTVFYDGQQSHWLFLIDTQLKKVVKELPLKLISQGYNGGNFKIVETNSNNCIIYCRHAGKNNAWLFDGQAFDLKMQLPYTYVHTCKTNQARNLIAIDHDNHTICLCSSSDPEITLNSYTIDSLTPLSMRFISDDYLMVTARDNFTVPALKASAYSKPFDASTHGEFRKNFESFKKSTQSSPEAKENKPETAAVYVFDLAQKKEIFKKNLFLKYGFRIIKPYFDEDGSLIPNSFALRDYGCFDGEWYMLSMEGFLGNK